MKVSLIESGKGRIEYCLHGQGRPVLIVHGGHVNCRETIFQKGLDPDEFCFITPSRPGYGNTPLTNLNKTPKGTADLFMELLDQLQLEKVTVVGISAGGLTALEIAAGYPERVEKLVLMSALTQKWFKETDKVYKGGKKIFAPQFEYYTWLLYRVFFKLFPGVMTRTMFKELSASRPINYTANECKELRGVTLKMRSGSGFHNDLDQNIDQAILSGIKCPTLILHSTNDNKVPVSHALDAKEKIKNTQLKTFSNRWGHMLWFGEEYEQVLKEVKQFINE